MWDCLLLTFNFMSSAHLDQLWISLSVHLPLSQSTISISFSLFIVLARWVDRDMHYSLVCPFCHCRAELSEQKGCKAELQSIKWALTLTTMGNADWMSQDVHANRKVLWAILHTLIFVWVIFITATVKFIGILLLSWQNTETTCFMKNLSAVHAEYGQNIFSMWDTVSICRLCTI